ncbi:MAG: ABC transporter substrate-binding protein [Candidatus Izemoplasmatales bacterium]|nr:ABC transporter substrate-binding protein [Candidatus Izemoplasmatales bacterium]
MKKLFAILLAAFLVIGIVACGGTSSSTTEPTSTTAEEENTLPVISGADNVAVALGDDFDPLEGVTATDAEDGAITNIQWTGTLDLTTVGDYTLTYTVTDGDGGVGTATRVVSVVVYPSGFYNLKFATTELRHTFMAAAEKFLMNTMYGGVPLFANGGLALYSERLQFPVDEYIPVMGFGGSFGTFSADDSTVKMDDGNPGEAGKYTYRTASTNDIENWNQWLYQTSTDSDFMGVYLDALYVYEFNEDKTGYAVNPSMASDNPTPVESHITETGKEVAKTWRIPLRTDLEWYYHPDTDVSGLPTGHEVIDANDFIATFKLALDLGWFRAISGGGDFISTRSTAILNAKEYRDGDATWDQVGLKAVDDNTLEFTFLEDQSEWNVRYFLSSFVMTPINIELYQALGGSLTDPESTGTYGSSNTTVAYHGAYYVDYYQADKVLRYEKNPNFHTPNMFFYTGYSFMIIPEAEVRFQEFIAGKLEGVSLPVADYEEYKDHPGIKKIPGSTTFRMMINGLGTEAAQREKFPDGTWVPEPILANHDFKMAMFFAVDRQNLAEVVLKTSTTQMYLFSDAYLVDPEMGVPYRATEQGATVGEGLTPLTYGYSPDAAAAYWNLAIDKLVEDGDYTPGTAGNYKVIDLNFYIFSGSEAQTLMGEYIKGQFEQFFTSDEHYIKVKVTVTPREFPNIYYDDMMTGEFDLAIGGISGSTLDAASFLDVFCDDNRGGFTLNWGIDTTTANVPVQYFDYEGVYHNEMWSFNAITSALNGLVYLQNGEEVDVPAPVITDITPTTYTFRINEFNNVAYQNITYTIQQWDLVSDNKYVNVEGMVDVPATTQEITVTGLLPYPYDYQIVLNYEYVDDPTLEATPTTTWDYSGEVVESVEVTDTSAVVTLNTDDRARIFTADSVKLYLEADDSEVTTATIVIDGDTVTITGLTAETAYYITFGTDDGFTDTFVVDYALYADIETEAAPAA